MEELSVAYEVRNIRNIKEKKKKNSTRRTTTARPPTPDGGLTDDGGVVLRRRGVGGDALGAVPSSDAVVTWGHSSVTRGWCGATRGLVPATAGLHEVSVAPRGDEIKVGTYRGAYCSGEALP